jgi:hypothetical protein
MTMMSNPVAKSHAIRRRTWRDSEADVETEIYVRPHNMPWDRMMVLQIMNDLDTRLPRVVPPPRRSSSRVVVKQRPSARVTPVPPPDEPNVFLVPWSPADPPPPWSTSHVEPAAVRAQETLLLEGRPARIRTVRHTRVPWLFFVMAFGIAFGIGQDPQLRRELGSKIKVTASQGAAMVARHVSAAF